MNTWKCTKVYTGFFLWATHFGKRAFVDRVQLLNSNVLIEITTADLRKIGLQMRGNDVSENLAP